jgi:hypothetical protein
LAFKSPADPPVPGGDCQDDKTTMGGNCTKCVKRCNDSIGFVFVGSSCDCQCMKDDGSPGIIWDVEIKKQIKNTNGKISAETLNDSNIICSTAAVCDSEQESLGFVWDGVDGCVCDKQYCEGVQHSEITHYDGLSRNVDENMKIDWCCKKGDCNKCDCPPFRTNTTGECCRANTPQNFNTDRDACENACGIGTTLDVCVPWDTNECMGLYCDAGDDDYDCANKCYTAVQADPGNSNKVFKDIEIVSPLIKYFDTITDEPKYVFHTGNYAVPIL